MVKQSVLALVLALPIAGPCIAAQEPAPKELVEYIRLAKKAGLKDAEIRKSAEAAGWSEAIVSGALGSAPASRENAAAPAAQPVAGGARPPAGVAPPRESAPPATDPVAPPLSKPSAEPAPPPKQHGVSDDYLIGPGDVLQIQVWREPDASVASTVVRPEGKISMPLLKEVAVAGLTPTDAERAITQQLSKFINAPDVTVVVAAINSKKIYVVGAVKNEGPIAYTYRMSVMQAISEAGGLTDYAKRKKIYVLRNEGGRDFRIPFDYDAVLRGVRMETNIPLLPGDTLVVPH